VDAGEAIRIIHATLLKRGFEFVRAPATYKGSVRVHGHQALVEIGVSDFTFATLPTVRLLDRSKVPIDQLAHVLVGGEVCYQDGGLLLDLHDPGGSVLRVLDNSATALERSFGGNAAADFERELASYWHGNRVFIAIPQSPEPAVAAAEVVPLRSDPYSSLVVVPAGAWKDALEEKRLSATLIHASTELKSSRAFPLSSLESALAYLDSQKGLPAGWRAALISAAAREETAFVSAPNAIIGWKPEYSPRLRAIKESSGVRPKFFQRALSGAANEVELHRLVGSRVDLTSAVQRNLAERPNLIGKSIALVGCGTIGGYLARLLAQAGAGCGAPLQLFDFDKLGPGNLGRHALGVRDLGRPKAVATAEHVLGFHPEVQVSPHVTDATACWELIEASDIIIDATGEANVSNSLNHSYQHSRQSGTELALLHSFVFGNGIAAQSLLNLKDRHACYYCLKTGFGGGWRFSPARNPASALELVPGTCGEGGYAPFSVDAPVAAAALALRAALDWAGGAPGPRLRTVIVDHAAGRDSVPWKSPDRLPGCPACGAGRLD